MRPVAEAMGSPAIDPPGGRALGPAADPHWQPVLHPDLLACAECDALFRRRKLAGGELLRCRRCGATLERGRRLGADGQLALTLAALFSLAIGSASPIVTLDLRDVESVASLFEAARLTWESGSRLIALLAVATAFAFPLVVILLRLWVLVPLVAGRKVQALNPVVRTLRLVTRWSMAEVFMLAVLVAVVRSAGITDVVLGPGIAAYTALMLLLAAIDAVSSQVLWQQAAGSRA